MLTQINVNGDNPFTVPIVGVTPKDSLLVQQVTGLNPPGITLFIGDYARDGGTYQGRRVEDRNVVVLMYLNPNPALSETVSSLRETLYKAFIDPSSEADYLKLDLELDDGRSLYVVGYVEKFETEIFSADSMVQVSIICPDPYIRDNNVTDLNHPAGWFTVPFSYPGSAETGFQTTIKVLSSTSRVVLANNTVTDTTTDPLYKRGRLILDHAFVTNDIITINTTPGAHAIWLTPAGGGADVSLIGAMTPTSPWLQLHASNNVMKVHGSTPADSPAVVTDLRFIPAYWGI